MQTQVRKGSYRYGFQGQEMDDEVKGKGNSVNYKFRMHDPRVGRFFAVDPLAYKFPYYSSYQFSSNSVIMAIELEGLESSIRVNFPEGSIIIERDENNRQQSVTYFQLLEIGSQGTNWSRNLDSHAYSDEREGGIVNVWCIDCPGDYGTKGYDVNIKIANDQVIQIRMVKVQVEIAETKWVEKSTEIDLGGSGDYFPNEHLPGVKDRFDSQIGSMGSNPKLRASKISVSFGKGVSEEDRKATDKGLKALFGNELKVEYNVSDSWDSTASFRLEAIEVEITVYKKVTKVERQESTIPAIEKVGP